MRFMRLSPRESDIAAAWGINFCSCETGAPDGRKLVIASDRWLTESAASVSSALALTGQRAQEAGFSVSWLVETQPAI